jgi:hypothetical protein
VTQLAEVLRRGEDLHERERLARLRRAPEARHVGEGNAAAGDVLERKVVHRQATRLGHLVARQHGVLAVVGEDRRADLSAQVGVYRHRDSSKTESTDTLRLKWNSPAKSLGTGPYTRTRSAPPIGA